MYIRQLRDNSALADLLMSAKGHLPGRESPEYDTVFMDECLDVPDECSFIADMLYDVMDKDDVILLCLFGSHLQKIDGMKFAFVAGA